MTAATPATTTSRRVLSSMPWAPMVAAVVAAGIAQLVLLATGFLATATDDAAHVLRAQLSSFSSSWLDPDVWPPLDEVAFGAVLRVWSDAVWAPRALTFLLGLATAAALVWLTWELTRDAFASWCSAALAALLPQRLVFGISTMGEVFVYLPVVVGAALTARWLRDGRRSDLFGAAVALGVATMARYEAWFVALLFGLMVLWQWRKRVVSTRDLVLVGIIVSALPLWWLIVLVSKNDPIDYLSITRQITLVEEPSTRKIVINSAGFRYLRDLIRALVLIIGIVELVRWVIAPGWRRVWTLTFFLSLPLLTAATVLTKSVPLATPWRLGGIWLMLTLPAGLAAVARWWRRPGWVLPTIAVAVVLLTFASWARTSYNLTKRSALTSAEVDLAKSLGRTPGRILIETPLGDFNYLDLVTASGDPDQFDLTRGDDPFLLGLFINWYDRWAEREPELIEQFASENIDLTDPEAVAALTCDSYGRVVVRTDEAVATLEAAGFDLVRERAGWSVFAPPDCTTTDG